MKEGLKYDFDNGGIRWCNLPSFVQRYRCLHPLNDAPFKGF